ncbi:MAG: hypothetical protein ACR2FM_03950 [Candidatus Saccharimonadales bacterium]
MALEIISSNSILFAPGPFDVHMHPRVTDGITEDAFVEINGGIEGKAGLAAYTEAAMRSGITGGGAMPNEVMRKYAPWTDEKTITVPYPISDRRSVDAMQSAIQQHSLLPMAVYAGIDPTEIFTDPTREHLNMDVVEKNFAEIKDEVMALKLWGDNSTGGYNIPKQFIPHVANRWNVYSPEKPVILHVEDAGVGEVLQDIARHQGSEIPIHIAHVSSRQELQAVIDAKEAGMNVTCEVTIHHLFLNADVRQQIGGYGCMKPSLKPQEDVDFLWANLKHIDMFASDCAPHRRSDKEGENPAFGVTNHSVMLPLLLGAVTKGRLTVTDIYKKFCVNTRQRFNIPFEDGSETSVLLVPTDMATLEHVVNPRYGHNPFTRTNVQAPLIGRIIGVKAGASDLAQKRLRPSYSHIITPRTVGMVALK